MASRKRSVEVTDFDNVSAEPSATVHGVVNSLSPIKKGRKSKYFDGSVSDGKRVIRFVGFSEEKKKKMQEFMDDKKPVQLVDCQIKPSFRDESKLEILVKSSTDIKKSEKEVDVSGIEFDDGTCMEINVCDIEQQCIFQEVSVSGKVIQVCKEEVIGDGRKKQDIFFGDSTGVARVCIWGETAGRMEPGKSYTLSNFLVKEYRGNKYLTMRKSVSEITIIDDIGLVKDLENVACMKEQSLSNPVLVGVSEFSKNKLCYRCNGKVEPGNGSLGKCVRSECSMVQKYSLCQTQLFARLMFTTENDRVTLAACGVILQKLAGVSNDELVTIDLLLDSRGIDKIEFNEQDVITQIRFKTVMDTSV